MRILISLLLLVAVASVAVSGFGGKNPFGHAMHKFFKGAFKKGPHGGKHNFNLGHSGSFSYSHSSSFSYSHSMSMSMSFSARGKRHCLKGCSHWQKDHCECNSGFKGVGDLCCYNPKEYNNTCVVRCDPYVTSSVGQSAQVFNPCGQTLTVIAAKTKSGKQSCKITVRSSDVIEKGIFATSQVQVTYEISSHEQEVVTLNGQGYSHSQGPFNPSSKEQFFSLKKRQSKSLTIRGEEIVVSRDAFRKIWTIKGCGTVINFRRNSNGGKPGVCISSEFPNAGQGQDKDSVCNLIPGNWLHGYHSKAAFYLAKSFELREHKRLSLHCYSKTCESVTKIFNGCGANQKKAMKMCSPILEARFRGCAFMYHKLDGSKLFKLYTDCMAAFCAGNKFWCKQQRKQKLFVDCPIHQMNCCLFKKTLPEIEHS